MKREFIGNKKKMSEKILGPFFAFGLILIFGSFLRQINFPDNNYQIDKGERINVVPGDILQQKFLATDDGLSRVGVLLGGKPLKKNYKINLILAGPSCRKDIFKTTIDSKFNSRYLYFFNFPIINNSKNKYFCLKVVYKAEVDKPKKREVRLFVNKEAGNNIQKYKQKEQRNLLEGYTILNSEGTRSAKESIVFRPYYKNNSFLKNIKQLNERLSQYKPYFMKSAMLSSMTVLMLVLSLLSIYFMIIM